MSEAIKKIDFTKVKIYSVSGEVVPIMVRIMGKDANVIDKETTISKQLGETVYMQGITIVIAELGKRIYEGKTVELREEDIVIIEEIINSDKFGFSQMVKRQIIDFMKK